MNKKTQKVKASLIEASKYLSSLGFVMSEPQNPFANGHDLIGIKNGRGFTFEVKAAFFNSRAWKISKVIRKDSDYIVIVFPSGVHIDTLRNNSYYSKTVNNICVTGLGLVYE